MVRDLERVKVYSPTPESRRRFVKEWGESVPAEVVETASVEEAVADADIVMATTNSISPLFSGDLLQPGVHVSCVKPCEFDATTYKRADPLIIHWREAKPFQIAIGVDRQSIPDITDGWQHPDHAGRYSDLGFSHALRSSSTANIRAGPKDDAITCFCNNVGSGIAVCRRVAAKSWPGRGRRGSDGKYRRNGFSNLCIHERPMKGLSASLRSPDALNVPQRVRLRSSVFARLAYKTFDRPHETLIGNVKPRKLILMLLFVGWADAFSRKRLNSKSLIRPR